MTDQFPLIKELGLSIGDVECLGKMVPTVHAADLERLLSHGVRVSGMFQGAEPLGVWGERSNNDTHTALLIGIRPFVRDTAEGLLRELAGFDTTYWGADVRNFAERARALLGEKTGPDSSL